MTKRYHIEVREILDYEATVEVDDSETPETIKDSIINSFHEDWDVIHQGCTGWTIDRADIEIKEVGGN